MSIYDNGSDGSNNYSNSYIKKYLEEVVKVKMGVTSVSLPKWKGKDTMVRPEIGPYNPATVKYKKVTAYVEAVRGSYKTLRNIRTNIYEGSNYAQYTWLGTHWTDNSWDVWYFDPSGSLRNVNNSHAFGLRPAIEY